MKSMNNDFYVSLGKKIRKIRERLGISQSEFAHKLGYKSDTAISLIESGKRKISTHTLKTVSQILSTPLSTLLEEENIEDKCINVALRNDSKLKDDDIKAINDFIQFMRKKNG